MITFKQALYESQGLRIDNPGGDWLKYKQEDAEEQYKKGMKVSGPVTGYYDSKLKLKTSALAKLPGARGEESYRENSSKLKDLEKDVGNPSNFNTKKNPILIGVNHKGEAHVIEGNHRLAYAHKHNIPHIHAEVRYFAGGEEIQGNFHPSKVESMRKKESIKEAITVKYQHNVGADIENDGKGRKIGTTKLLPTHRVKQLRKNEPAKSNLEYRSRPSIRKKIVALSRRNVAKDEEPAISDGKTLYNGHHRALPGVERPMIVKKPDKVIKGTFDKNDKFQREKTK